VRIAVITTSYPANEGDPSGHFVRAEVREYEREGHEVVVVRPPPGGAFGWPGVGARVRERWARALGAGAWVMRARGEVARAGVHRVVAHWAVPSAWPIAVPGRSEELHVVSHGGDVRLLLAMPAPARERLAAAIATRASVWRFVSEGLKVDLLQGLREAREKVERIAVVRAASFELLDVKAQVLARKRELGGRRAAVVVGRLVPSKRVDRVIEHVAAGRTAEVLVVVGDGPERERLEAMARQRGVLAWFTGLLPRDEALAWMGAANVLLHASSEEGCSTVLREAEALGVPWERIG
jgi:glycosyltransferase involved in cell wall biosynthesis